MKIVIAETILDSSIIGGGSLYLPGLMKGLVSRGHEVHLVLKGIPNPRIAEFIYESGAVVHIKPWKKRGIVTDLAPMLADWINQMKPDVYMVSASYDIGWLALPLLDTKIATVVVAHSNTDNFYFPVRHYSDFITYAIGVSDEICNKFNKVSKMPEERIEWIPYGIKPAVSLEERITAGKLTIVFAGRMEEYQKKISDVKEIIKKIATAGIRYHFKLIGDGTMYEPIKEELAVEIGKGNVEMPGWIAGEKVLEAFQESDVFILTSSSEGFSISLIEAMANGCCPVVTDIPSGSIQLIKSGSNGYLIPVGDIETFREKLGYLSDHRDELQRMRTAAWETGKKYSIDRMVESYIACFDKGVEYLKLHPRNMNQQFPVMDSCRSKYPAWLRRIKLYLLNETGFTE